VVKGKSLCKTALQRRFGVAQEPRKPLMGMIARLVEQKGIDLVGKVMEPLIQKGAQVVILGDGDAVYHRMLNGWRSRYPQQVGVAFTFDDALAHQIEAGADIYLMPSLYEPAGLNQLYSLKYGTVPVVRATGGLADTITDCNPSTISSKQANGFTFGPYTAAAFLGALDRALAMHQQSPEKWLELIANGMAQDWSWDRMALEYEKLFGIVANV
jgi:starch synthase